MQSPSHIGRRLLTYRRTILFTLLTLIISSAAQVALAGGTLDPSFGNGGKVTTSFDVDASIKTVLAQPDGKIVAVGGRYRYGQTDSKVALVRYNNDGTLDMTFGSGGRVTTDVEGLRYEGKGAVLQNDGKIVVVCGTRTTPDGTALVRYNSDGSLDTGFGANGIVISTLITNNGYDIALQADGKLVVVGQGAVFNAFYIARYLSDGSVDTGFGSSGVSIITIPTPFTTAQAVTLQPDGKILVGGLMHILSPRQVLLRGVIIRLESNGNLDNSFGSDGMIRGLAEQEIRDLLVQPDGKILAVTLSHLYRFNMSGQSEATFAATQVPVQNSMINFTSLGLLPNGKIVVGGRILNNGIATINFFVMVLNRDVTFNGAFDTDFFGGRDEGNEVAIQPNGKIVAGGYGSDGQFVEAFALSRYSVSPARNGDFDGDGKTEIAVWRPDSASWLYLNSSNGVFHSSQWGLSTDALVPGDYDGDAMTDRAVFRGGVWKISQSSNSLFVSTQWGLSTDVPVPGDYDGDGKTDVAVFRNGNWHILCSSNNTLQSVGWGLGTDKPVQGDYDGDGKTDVAVYRPGNGTWYVNLSLNGAVLAQPFGLNTDRPVQGDYDRDGKTDIAVFRPSDAKWHILQSTSGYRAEVFGISTDTPVPGDYDGDGKTDVAVFRGGTWHLNESSSGYRAVQWGLSTDVPVPSAYYP
jgi:uncharacterized delta-60 repeat protein